MRKTPKTLWMYRLVDDKGFVEDPSILDLRFTKKQVVEAAEGDASTRIGEGGKLIKYRLFKYVLEEGWG